MTLNPGGEPKVSVIIAAFNAASYIGKAIESVLSQTLRDVELIVVDDGSTDRTAEIVKGYGERVRYLFQENAERSAARNNGIAHARGDYLSFLDADDLIAPEKLADQTAFLEGHPEYDLVYSRVAYFTEKEQDNYYTPRRITPEGDVLYELTRSNFITIHSPLIRRSAIERSGGFDPNFNRFEDWDFLVRLSLAGARFGFIEGLHAFVRVHPANTVQDRVRMFEAKRVVAEKIVDGYAQELRSRGVDPERLLALHRADYGRILILAGRVAEGRRLIGPALGQDFPHRKSFALFFLGSWLVNYRLLAMVQAAYDRFGKYRRRAAGGRSS